VRLPWSARKLYKINNVSFVIITLFSQSINHKGEETIIYESFEGGFPYNWDITWEGSPIGHGNWITNEYTMHPYNHPPYDGDMLIYFDSFTAYPGYYARLETPMNNFAAFSDATLTFFMFHDDELPDLNDQLIIQYRVDQGEWISLDTIYRVWENYNLEWVRHEIDLTETVCGNSNVTIAFWGISAYGNDINIDMMSLLRKALKCKTTSFCKFRIFFICLIQRHLLHKRKNEIYQKIFTILLLKMRAATLLS